MDSLVQTKPDRKEILAVLTQFIVEVIGEEFAEDLVINNESSFTKDLEMDSIEIVAFSEKVKLHFGVRVDFTGWLSGMDLDQLIALKLGHITAYIESCL
ncbi:acyl carrier protein [Filimonas lacunae]|uniref:Acyl carrier protein n=1 Tax=Filimonas lacunae TaxID=477680 RepID=A0A173M9B6_9BACT|nr:phosphopantetheine-binding protein [Filimonas lacunae]BAV04112.1 acyl carrier protein [Filimonas lacunae]SIT15340.1 acyl carrier protein [Filimonas lacunae]